MEKRANPRRDPHFSSPTREPFRRARQEAARSRLLRDRLPREPRRESPPTGRFRRRPQSPWKFPRLESRETASREMSDLIVREQEPLNLEMPFSSLDGFL